jgi:hypothetical protein
MLTFCYRFCILFDSKKLEDELISGEIDIDIF